jgi:hypothetical protein
VAHWVVAAIADDEPSPRTLRVIPLCDEHLARMRTWNRSSYATEIPLGATVPDADGVSGLCESCLSRESLPDSRSTSASRTVGRVRSAVVVARLSSSGGGVEGPSVLCGPCTLDLLALDPRGAGGIRALNLTPVDPQDPWLPPGATVDDLYGDQPSAAVWPWASGSTAT